MNNNGQALHVEADDVIASLIEMMEVQLTLNQTMQRTDQQH